MAGLYAPDPLRSRPIRLHWAGWETDTHRLQRAGWDLSADQDVTGERDGPSLRIAMRNRALNVRGISETARLDPYGYRQPLSWSDLHLRVEIASQMTMLIREESSMFAAIDARPQYRPLGRMLDIDDFAHFAPIASQPRIIVPDDTVPELLERILKLQQPERTERIRREIREEARPMKFHAQILSFAA